MMSPALEAAKTEARRRWQRMTPFRLGLIIGEGPQHIASPYVSRRSTKLYNEGVTFSRAKRDRNGES